MSDLIERAREASTLKYQYHTIHVPTILIRMADEADKAAAELSALQALHAAGSAPYDAEIDRLQKRNAELGEEVERLRVDAGRLDWLQANDDDWPFTNLNGEWVYVYLAGPVGGDKGAGVCEAHYTNLRAAIDAAKEPGNG